MSIKEKLKNCYSSNEHHEIINLKECCPWCKSTQFTLYIEARDWRHSIPGTFRLYTCNRCGLVKQIPTPSWERISTYYPDDYVAFQETSQEESWFSNTIKRVGYSERIRLVNSYKNGVEWLDVGCGTGEFLGYLQQFEEWNLYGLEPIKEAAQRAEERTNIPIIKTAFENISGFDENFFDVITMWEVIEHLYNPILAIETASKILKPGGILIMSTPNLLSLDRLIFKKYWAGYDLPRHLHLFPTSTLKNICDSNNLACLQTICLGGSYTAWLIGLQSWNTKMNSRIIQFLLSSNVIKYLMQIATYLPRKILHSLKKGTSITYVFRKNE